MILRTLSCIALLSQASTASFSNFSDNETKFANTYYLALGAVEKCDIPELIAILDEEYYGFGPAPVKGSEKCRQDLSLEFGIKRSLLFEAAFKGSCLDALPVLKAFEVEVGGSFAFRKQLFEGTEYSISVEVAQMLVQNVLLVLEDLWPAAIQSHDPSLWSWLHSQGADINHILLLPRNTLFSPLMQKTHLSPSMQCISKKRFDLLRELLDAGAEVNNGLWSHAIEAGADEIIPFLPEIAAETENLFSFLDDHFSTSSAVLKAVDEVLSAEVLKRLEEQSIDLKAIQKTARWNLLDSVLFLRPSQLPKIAQVLYDAGMRSAFPFAFAFVTGDTETADKLYATGRVNLHDSICNKNLLTVAVEDPTISEERILWLLNQGCLMNFLDFLKTRPNASNALLKSMSEMARHSEVSYALRWITKSAGFSTERVQEMSRILYPIYERLCSDEMTPALKSESRLKERKAEISQKIKSVQAELDAFEEESDDDYDDDNRSVTATVGHAHLRPNSSQELRRSALFTHLGELNAELKDVRKQIKKLHSEMQELIKNRQEIAALCI